MQCFLLNWTEINRAQKAREMKGLSLPNEHPDKPKAGWLVATNPRRPLVSVEFTVLSASLGCQGFASQSTAKSA